MAAKPGLEVVIGGLGKPKTPMADEPDDTMGGKDDAAQALMEALDSKDAGAVAQALSAFIDLSKGGPPAV